MSRSLTRLALALTAAAAVLSPAVLAAPADASQYVLPHAKLPKARTVSEGQTAKLAIRIPTCKFTECTYRIFTAPGTAKVDGKGPGSRDYNPFAYMTRTLEKGERWNPRFAVKTLTDTHCEGAETFSVKVEGDFHIRDRHGSPGPVVDTSRITIRSERPCLSAKPVITQPDVSVRPQETPPPPPAPAPAPPADATEPTTTVTDYGTGRIVRCTTPFQVGNPDVYGAWGHYIKGCTVKVPCPVTSRVCSASAESAINTESYVGHRVTLNQRLAVSSASGNEFFNRTTNCGLNVTDWCRTEDLIMVRGGETATVACDGMRDSGPGANRAKVSCSINLDYNAG